VVYNDVRAAGLLRACAELGIAVPGRLSLASHDNITLASLVTPSLTTVDIPKYEMGRRGAVMMLDMLTDRRLQPETIRLTPRLVVRESTATPNAKGAPIQ
jgi:DNA-binding LacI/PurR family transcriptional regulator